MYRAAKPAKKVEKFPTCLIKAGGIGRSGRKLLQTSSVTVVNFRSPQYLSSVFLNTFSDSAFTILSGRLFHVLIILFEKKCWNFLVTQWGLNNFLELVRVMQSFFLNSVLVVSLSYILCTILYVSITSPLDLLYSRLGIFRALSLIGRTWKISRVLYLHSIHFRKKSKK